METISIMREVHDDLLLPAVRNTIRIIPEIIKRKPPVGSMLHLPPVISGKQVKGCFVSRITSNTAPYLLLLAAGKITVEGHRSQTRGIYFHVLETDDKSDLRFSLTVKSEKQIREYEDLDVKGFEIRGERGKALYIKISVNGKNEVLYENSSGMDEFNRERFFFFSGEEISVNGTLLNDAAGFSIEGETDSDGVKHHSFSIRRKETDRSNFENMRGSITAVLRFENPDMYEPFYNASFSLTLENCIYEGEESYPGEEGIWGRKFRYQVYGGIKATVYTADEEILKL